MPTTTNAGLPYPAGGAAPNVPYDMQQLAEELDDLLDVSLPVADIVLAGSYATTSEGAKAVVRNGRVQCEGGIVAGFTGGDTNLIGTLPSGYRPFRTKRFPLATSVPGGYGRITVGTDGTITAYAASGSLSFGTVYLDNIAFELGF